MTSRNLAGTRFESSTTARTPVISSSGGKITAATTPARAVLCASASLSLHYVPGTGTSTGAQSCSDSFRCHEAKRPAAPYFLKVNPSCDPNLQGCLVQLRVPLEAPGNQGWIADRASATWPAAGCRAVDRPPG